MPNLEGRLEAVVAQSEVDGSKWHTIVHGDDTTTVPTENGNVPSVAKQLKDVRAEIINGLEDYVGDCRQAKADTLQIKSETQIIKNETNTLKGQTKTLRDEAETFKELSQTTYNSIASATAASISQVQSEGAVQVALATAQAERALAYAQNAAPTPLGTKLTVPASSKVPDGYEPVWYKNTITRSRYPDFFTQLVDTDSLTLVTEATYDSQVSTYGMCASYVKVDNNTLILPLLVNFARGGTPNQLGNVQNDQMQGHWHEMVYRQDSTSSGYRSDIFGTDGYTSGSYSNTGGTDEWMQRLGNRKNDALCAITPITDNTNGTPRVGAETRPKAYYELTYIKCADVSRTIAMEETSEIRNLLSQIKNTLNNIPYIVEEQKGTNWYIKWSNGILEQGGTYDKGSQVTDWSVNITMNVAFINTNYQLNCQLYRLDNATGSINNQVFIINRTSSMFTARPYGDGSSRYIDWYARGYWK